MKHKLRSADDLSNFERGFFIVREKIKKLMRDHDQESMYYSGEYHACMRAIDDCNNILDIKTLGDIASTKEELNHE